jgi:aminoglycoside phosphotransferase (APT) family kinase protein
MNAHDVQEQLPLFLRQLFGSKVELISYEIGNQHPDYLVLLIQLGHPSMKIVVKIAGPQAPLACPFDRTAMLHRLVAQRTAIPMPEVLAVDVSYRIWPWRYFVKAHIPGQEWVTVRRLMSAQELSLAYQQIGNAVAQLHSIHFSAFGELTIEGNVQQDSSLIVALQARAHCFIKNPRLRDLFLTVVDDRQALFSGVRQSSLCHEDLHQHNILFDHRQGEWHLATILDFDKAWAGHSETDLARLDLWRGMTDRSFWRSYEAICPVSPLYKQRRLIYQLLW